MTMLSSRSAGRTRAEASKSQSAGVRNTPGSQAARERLESQLRQLARLRGVETEYLGDRKQVRRVSVEALLAIVGVLGSPLESLADVPQALCEERLSACKQITEPVIVAWDGKAASLEIRLPEDAQKTFAWELQLESGETRRHTVQPGRLVTVRRSRIEGTHYLAKRMAIPGSLPFGYHRLSLALPGRTTETLVISAPTRAFGESAAKTWGLFAPVYSLHSSKSWGSGDLGDFETLLDWTHQLGGSAVASLPLLATFLDEPFEPSPYSPASRLFWNEFCLDLESIPELETSEAARDLLRSPELQQEVGCLRAEGLVDYRRGMAVKRRVLECLARSFFKNGSGERQEEFGRFLVSHPQAEDYAQFRAAGEELRSPWPSWPERLRGGQIEKEDYRQENQRYHLYVQWLADKRLKSIARKASRRAPGLCLDLPLGINAAGYDVWRWRELFARSINAGAPPDIIFTGGQNWGFPPLHPEAIRRDGYRYHIACLRHHLQHAGLLRMDHVMGLHRLFWIPPGFDPTHGTYVRYHAEELYAILCVESHRSRSLIAGENLGIVPHYVNPALRRHNIQGLFVVEYELAGRDKLPRVPSGVVASLNTHDMAPFGAFWEGLDIEKRLDLGFVSRRAARAEARLRQAVRKSLPRQLQQEGWLEDRSASAEGVLRALLQRLSASKAKVLLINLEDLWLEFEPQNVPGTDHKRPNWRRKARHSLETFCHMPEVTDTLAKLSRLRKA